LWLIETTFLYKEIAMYELLLSTIPAISPVLGSFIWVGGGSVGLIVLIVIIVLIVR
jgi:hypothetical protein